MLRRLAQHRDRRRAGGQRLAVGRSQPVLRFEARDEKRVIAGQRTHVRDVGHLSDEAGHQFDARHGFPDVRQLERRRLNATFLARERQRPHHDADERADGAGGMVVSRQEDRSARGPPDRIERIESERPERSIRLVQLRPRGGRDRRIVGRERRQRDLGRGERAAPHDDRQADVGHGKQRDGDRRDRPHHGAQVDEPHGGGQDADRDRPGQVGHGPGIAPTAASSSAMSGDSRS